MSDHNSEPLSGSLVGSREVDWPGTSESSYEILQRAADRVASSASSGIYTILAFTTITSTGALYVIFVLRRN